MTKIILKIRRAEADSFGSSRSVRVKMEPTLGSKVDSESLHLELSPSLGAAKKNLLLALRISTGPELW